jgi:ribosome biogenesis GTPase A
MFLGKPLKVGAKPGVTRALQTKIRVSDEPLVFLLDTPGIMMPNIGSLSAGMNMASCGKS